MERECGVPLKVHQDYEEMLRDAVLDVVSICTPHPFHPQLAIAAAEAGKHLIIEKPFSLTFDESKAILAAVDKAGVNTCVCFECRYSRHFSLIRVDHPYQPQFQAYVDSIQNREPMPLTDLTTAFETHRVLFAAELSAAEGRPVKVSELT